MLQSLLPLSPQVFSKPGLKQLEPPVTSAGPIGSPPFRRANKAFFNFQFYSWVHLHLQCCIDRLRGRLKSNILIHTHQRRCSCLWMSIQNDTKHTCCNQVGSGSPGMSLAFLQVLFMTPFWKHPEKLWQCLSRGQVGFGERMVMQQLRRGPGHWPTVGKCCNRT